MESKWMRKESREIRRAGESEKRAKETE